VTPIDLLVLAGAGFAIGIYATAIGAGGGFLLAPLLLARYADAPPVAITTAALSVIVLSSGLAALRSERERRVDRRLAVVLVAATMPTALLGAATTALLPRTLFAVGFAALLLVVGLYLAWRPEPGIATPVRRGWQRSLVDRDGSLFRYRVPLRRSVAAAGSAAFIAALAGIGGGLIYTPLAIRVMRLPHTLAVPLSYVVITAIAVIVVLFHLAAGHAGEPMEAVPPLAIGVVAANPVGRRLHRLLGEGALLRVLAAGLLVVSVSTLAVALRA